MNKESLKKLIKEAVKEAIILKRYGDDILAVSDLEDPKARSGETFRAKTKLKNAGFKWDSNVGSWKAKKGEIGKALDGVTKINKDHPIIDKFENLPEFIMAQEGFDLKAELAKKVDSYINSLMSDVDDVVNSDELQRFMEFNSKFRNYSMNNTLLIYIQRPSSVRVAGFHAWKKLHRRVKKGAKSITIFAPMSKKKDEINLDTSVKEKKFMFFRPVKVFDISDTEAIDERGEIPNMDWTADNTPNETADKLVAYSLGLADSMGIDVTHEDSQRGEQGYSAGNKINLSSHIDGVEKAGTFIHEIAHELLHHKEGMFFQGDKLPPTLKELQAESVAYLVLKHYDLPVKQMAKYLAMWKANKQEIMKNLQVLKKTANFIIEELDKVAKRHGG